MQHIPNTHSFKTTLVLLLLLMLQTSCYSQKNGEVKFVTEKYPFVHPERNMITNAGILDTLLEKLYQQRTANNQHLHLLQIGDSHIQADYLSAQVRTDFQHDFGNAGRGVVVPLRVAGSNEPFNYKITSNVVCTSKRCVFVNDPLPIGIGGVTVQTNSDSVYFRVKAFDNQGLHYGFKKVTLFYQRDTSSYEFALEDSAGNKLGQFTTDAKSDYDNSMPLLFTSALNDVTIRAQKTKPNQNTATIFGLNLENDTTGVIYSSVGVNGAEAFQYARARYFAEQTKALQPQLIILSLGTNEAQHRPLDKDLTTARLDSLIQLLQRFNQQTPIILTTPPDSYSRKKYFNPSVAAVHEVIVDYAKAHNLACWDLFSITGGYKSCYQWKKHHLMRADGIHFNKEGYEFQANLFYEAFIKAYNHYVGHRR